MNEEKIQELLKYLAFIGFSGQQLEQDIRKNVQSGTPHFNVEHEIPWGEELMRFDLRFQLDHQFKGHRLEWYRATHIAPNGITNNTNYRPSAYGACHANLAFYSLSGRLNDLSDKLSFLNLGEFPGVDAQPNLEKMLSQNLNEFTLKCSHNEPEGYIEYNIPVSKIDGWYTLDAYTATLTPYPEIEHGVFNGINTKELEMEMRAVNWYNDQELFILQEDSEPELLPPTTDILHKILQLDQDAKGMLVADILKLKYWSDASYFDSFIDQRTWDISNALPRREQQFPVELEAKAAFNQLCGRAILRDKAYPFDNNNEAWIRIDFTTVGPNGGYLSQVTPPFDIAEIKATLDILPLSPDQQVDTFRKLLRGDLANITLNNDRKIFLQVNPEQKKIEFFSEDMRPIQVNLQFDPDWKPAQNPELNPEELQRKHRQNIVKPDDPPDKNNRFRRRR